jgi:hypothetical protein
MSDHSFNHILLFHFSVVRNASRGELFVFRSKYITLRCANAYGGVLHGPMTPKETGLHLLLSITTLEKQISEVF